MLGALKKYGFAAAVVGLVAAATGGVVLREVAGAGAEQAQQGGGQGPGRGPGGPGGGSAAKVRVEAAAIQPFFDSVRAIGTAQANESIVITPKVTDVIRSIRFESGDRVRKGQVLVELASVEQAADLAEARASLEVETREYARFNELAERGFAPAARVDAARAAFERAEARVEALEARIADRVILAPFAGVVGLRSASPGALARPGDPLGTLDDVSVIKLDFDVPETQLGPMRPGATIVASAAAYPGEAFTGEIDVIDSRVDAQTRTLRVRALLPNADGRLKPGMLLSVEVRANPREALSVPEVALTERADGAFVLRVAQGPAGDTVEQIPVRAGARFAGRVEILEGLAPGDRVVTDGMQRARPGAPVEVTPASPPAADAGPAPARS